MKLSKYITKNKRIKILFISTLILFLALSFRLYYLQVFKNEEFTTGALNQRGKKIDTEPSRGIIFDRNLIPLTNNDKTPTLIISRELLDDSSLYSYIRNHSSLDFKALEEKKMSNNVLLNIPLKEKIDLNYLKKNAFLVDMVDRYNKMGTLSHVIGYINESDNSGQTGIEKTYDEFLKIEPRESFIVEYDRDRKLVLGGQSNVNSDIDPSNPAGVKLTIDYDIQCKVEDIMDNHNINGAVVVGEVSSGEILALASRPNFNQKNVESYFQDINMALYNKAIQGNYPPGSIFKIVVLLAAIEDNPDIINRRFFCEGFEEIDGRMRNCNNVHGEQSLKEAFSNSCNSTFVQIAREIGGKKILDVAKRLGLGSKINIGLIEEIEGNLPEVEETYGEAIANIAIGQGSLEVTPLQITNLLMTIANDGIDKKLSLVKGITNIDGKMIKEYFKESDQRLISSLGTDVLKEMLIEVVKSGTAKSMDLDLLGGAGGKTGSSEARYNGSETIHGWFSGFYPENNPKYIITILIENAPRGSVDTLPIFKEIVEKIKQD